MKRTRLFIGIFLGGIFVCIVLIFISIAKPGKQSTKKSTDNNDLTQWDWPSSLDALIAAPGFHKLIFENDEFRIMEVVINPGQTDPVHTHKGKSIVWIVKSSRIVNTVYGKGTNNKLIPLNRDTITITPDELNKANWQKPEPPHSIENIGTDPFMLYRIEYKEN